MAHYTYHSSFLHSSSTKLTRFATQASAVARLTLLMAQNLLSAGADSKLYQRGHRTLVSASPARKASCPAAIVTFATEVEVIASTPGRSSPVDGLASPDLLMSIRRFSLSLPQLTCSTFNRLPAYVLFPMDGEVPLSTSSVSTVPVPLGFAPIGPPGSLAVGTTRLRSASIADLIVLLWTAVAELVSASLQ